jgi:hypothetical protein
MNDSAIGRALAGRAKGLAVLLGLTVLLSAPFVVWGMREALRYDVTTSNEVLNVVPEGQPALPAFAETRDPLAILVLDLSGSMKKNDPTREQLRAVDTFLRIYLHMSRGVTRDSAPPHLAVVLYSSAAKVVEFDGEWWRALGSPGDVETIVRSLARVIGAERAASDGRVGWNTDHLAAARRVGDVVARYRSKGYGGSAGVLFMTDGEYDPNPLLDASLGEEEIAANRAAFWSRLAREARSAAGKAALADARSRFEAWVGGADRPVALESDSLAGDLFPIHALQDEVTKRVFAGRRGWYERVAKDLRRGRAGEGVWFRVACGLGAGDLFRLVELNPGAEPVRDEPQGEQIEISDARLLEPAFAGVLASWLGLRDCRVGGDGAFDVEPGARALAAIVWTARGPASGSIVCGGQRHDLRRGLTLVADPAPGRCEVDLGGERALRVRAFADSRYRWALAVADGFSILDAEPEVTLGLYRIDAADPLEPAQPADLYVALPERATARATFPSAEVRDVALGWSEARRLFAGRLPRPRTLAPGRVVVDAKLEGLRYTGGQQAPGVDLSTAGELREAVSVRMLQVGPGGAQQPIAGVRSVSVPRRGEMRSGE